MHAGCVSVAGTDINSGHQRQDLLSLSLIFQMHEYSVYTSVYTLIRRSRKLGVKFLSQGNKTAETQARTHGTEAIGLVGRRFIHCVTVPPIQCQ